MASVDPPSSATCDSKPKIDDFAVALSEALQKLGQFLSNPKATPKAINDCIRVISSLLVNLQKTYPRRDSVRDKLFDKIKSSVTAGVKRLADDSLLDVREQVISPCMFQIIALMCVSDCLGLG